jgi:4-hydroxy-tetrahydrodipicolinate reductase
MTTVVFGDGNLGRAIAAGIAARDGEPPRLLGRPVAGAGHRPIDLEGVDLAFEASRGDAVVANVRAAASAGCRRFVVATTGWDAARSEVDEILWAHGASAVVGANLSIGVAHFLLLVEAAAKIFGPLAGYDPYVVEWHRRDKRDRPSGTAREIADRVLAAHPSKDRVAALDGPPGDRELEVVSVRAGASPGMHVVGFDAPGESVELRLTARDRSAYVAGALAAADWLDREPRTPGIYSFSTVVQDLAVEDLAVEDLVAAPSREAAVATL